MRLTDLSPLLIEKYRAERLKSGVQKSTTNRELALLKKIFNLAIDWGFAAANPVLKVRFFSEKDNQKERVLSEEEEIRLLAHCSQNFKPIVITALNTGMRRNEILSLKWCEVDLKQRQILVTRTKAGRNRLIPMNDTLFEVLRSLKPVSKSEYVFTSSRGKHFSTIRRAFTSACLRAGIKGLRFHDLRHTFGTRLIRSGVDIVTVQHLLGHYSVTVTQRYTHTDAGQKRAAVNRLAARAGQIPEKLTHIWHTGKKKDKAIQLTYPVSMN
jgi:integrase